MQMSFSTSKKGVKVKRKNLTRWTLDEMLKMSVGVATLPKVARDQPSPTICPLPQSVPRDHQQKRTLASLLAAPFVYARIHHMLTGLSQNIRVTMFSVLPNELIWTIVNLGKLDLGDLIALSMVCPTDQSC